MVSSFVSAIPIPSAADFLGNLNDYLRDSRTDRLLASNARLNRLRDWREELEQAYHVPVLTNTAFTRYLEQCDALPKMEDGSRPQPVFAGGVGAALGLAFAGVARGTGMAKRLNYLASAITGGSVAIAVDTWRSSKREVAVLNACVDAYENYLRHVEEALKAGKPAPRLAEELADPKAFVNLASKSFPAKAL